MEANNCSTSTGISSSSSPPGDGPQTASRGRRAAPPRAPGGRSIERRVVGRAARVRRGDFVDLHWWFTPLAGARRGGPGRGSGVSAAVGGALR